MNENKALPPGWQAQLQAGGALLGAGNDQMKGGSVQSQAERDRAVRLQTEAWERQVKDRILARIAAVKGAKTTEGKVTALITDMFNEGTVVREAVMITLLAEALERLPK